MELTDSQVEQMKNNIFWERNISYCPPLSPEMSGTIPKLDNNNCKNDPKNETESNLLRMPYGGRGSKASLRWRCKAVSYTLGSSRPSPYGYGVNMPGRWNQHIIRIILRK